MGRAAFLPRRAVSALSRARGLDVGLLQPVRHLHLAVHPYRRSEMLLRQLALARAPVELAEAEVAVGDEGTHAEVAGQIERLAIETLRSIEIRRRCTRLDLGEESQDSCFVTPTAEATVGVEGVPSRDSSVACTAAQEIYRGQHLLHPGDDAWPPGTFALEVRLFDERQALFFPAGQRLRVTPLATQEWTQKGNGVCAHDA